MKKLSLDEIKKLQIDMLNMFDTFCTEHGLTYQLAYGTLLGAVRHKGFIPWDDDIDLSMPIEDYKRMCDIINDRHANGMFDDRYRLADMYVESTVPYHQSFAKIYDTKTTAAVSGLRKDVPFEQAVFIDIFPIVGMPENNEEEHALYTALEHANTMLYWAVKDIKASDFNLLHPRRAVRNLYEWLSSRKKPYNAWLDEYGEILAKFPDCKEAKVAYDIKNVFMEGEHCLMDNNPWAPSIRVEFEGLTYPGPKRYDEILSKLYGNYMQLPPEEQRKPSHDQDFFLLD